MEKIYLFAGKKYTEQEFADKFKGGDLIEGKKLLDILLMSGKAMEVGAGSTNIEEALIEEAIKKASLLDKAEELTSEEQAEKRYIVDKKREYKLTYDEVAFEFPTSTKAEAFESTLNDMYIKCSVTKNSETRLWEVVVQDITEKDLNKVTTLYNAQKVVDTTLNTVDSVANKTVGAVSYASEKVVVPTVQVAGKAGMSIFKTLAKTAVKTGGTLTSAIVHGVRETVTEIKHDPDVIKASADLRRTGIDVKQSIGKGKHTTKVGSGIHFR